VKYVRQSARTTDESPVARSGDIGPLLAKDYALTGTRIRAERAVELGLANHTNAASWGHRPLAGETPWRYSVRFFAVTLRVR
jgi:hypothetical protein